MSSEREKLARFFASRHGSSGRGGEGGEGGEEGGEEEEEEEELEAVRQARLDRRREEQLTSSRVASLVARAEAAASSPRPLEGVALYTEALSLEPRNVALLDARGSLCARLNHHKATLHDGEMIVSLTPHWHRGHALCGMALFCLQQYAPAVRAYRRSLEFCAASSAGEGVRLALADAQAKVDEALRRAALTADEESLRRLLQDGGMEDGLDRRSAVDLEAADEQHGFTPLMLATAAGKVRSAQMLLDAKASTEARDKFGKTALCWAAGQGNEKLVSLLLAGGGDPSASDRSGWDGLMAACHGGHSRIVTVLMQRASHARRAADGSTCLHVAAQAGRTEVVRLLLKQAADPSVSDTKGQRALELARKGSSAAHVQVAKILQPLTPEAPPASSKLAGRLPTVFMIAAILALLLALS